MACGAGNENDISRIHWIIWNTIFIIVRYSMVWSKMITLNGTLDNSTDS
ncbi:hypothetical protein RSAG8_13911, partial [Rhizoctonia solani AG-8 WAC10335]